MKRNEIHKNSLICVTFHVCQIHKSTKLATKSNFIGITWFKRNYLLPLSWIFSSLSLDFLFDTVSFYTDTFALLATCFVFFLLLLLKLYFSTVHIEVRIGESNRGAFAQQMRMYTFVVISVRSRFP